MSETLRLGPATVARGGGLTLTAWKDDERELLARAHDTPEYAAAAASLGYPDGEAMNATHDVVHSVLAEALGWERGSPALRHEAQIEEAPAALRHLEELAVMALESAANGLWSPPGYGWLVERVKAAR